MGWNYLSIPKLLLGLDKSAYFQVMAWCQAGAKPLLDIKNEVKSAGFNEQLYC